jgi:hypothetical protein
MLRNASYDVLVRVLLEERPGNDHRAARPRDVVVVQGPVGGTDIAHAPVLPLRVLHVLEPLGIERVDAEEVRLSPRLGGPVAEPPLALVALRAIGGHAPVVAPDPPHDVPVYPVDAGVRAGEVGRALHVVIHHPPLERRPVRPSGKAGHLDVAEAVVCEPRLIDLRALPLERVNVGDLRAPDVVG